MARPIAERLDRLTRRRSGLDRSDVLNEAARLEILAKSLEVEPWRKRVSDSRPYTRYALGAMQEVGETYTRVSVQTADRVAKQLDTALASSAIPSEFALQGSVPLNVHIRGVSDVDLLAIRTDRLVYDSTGVRGRRGDYIPTDSWTSVQILTDLRSRCEQTLRDKYPAAKVDCSGAKSIKISGGSLARPVDVVPSLWFDSSAYQQSQDRSDRGVKILDKTVPTCLTNWPFTHISRVEAQDRLALYSLKKAIRLCKSVKNDAQAEVALSSFDITSLLYHADQRNLSVGAVFDLAILAESQRWLDFLYANRSYAESLRTPDESRAILDNASKWDGLRTLSVELDELLREVWKEHTVSLGKSLTAPLGDVRTDVSSIYIPGA